MHWKLEYIKQVLEMFVFTVLPLSGRSKMLETNGAKPALPLLHQWRQQTAKPRKKTEGHRRTPSNHYRKQPYQALPFSSSCKCAVNRQNPSPLEEELAELAELHQFHLRMALPHLHHAWPHGEAAKLRLFFDALRTRNSSRWLVLSASLQGSCPRPGCFHIFSSCILWQHLRISESTWEFTREPQESKDQKLPPLPWSSHSFVQSPHRSPQWGKRLASTGAETMASKSLRPEAATRIVRQWSVWKSVYCIIVCICLYIHIYIYIYIYIYIILYIIYVHIIYMYVHIIYMYVYHILYISHICTPTHYYIAIIIIITVL